MSLLPVFVYSALTESFCKRLVDPRARRLHQQAYLLSLVPSCPCSWHSILLQCQVLASSPATFLTTVQSP